MKKVTCIFISLVLALSIFIVPSFATEYFINPVPYLPSNASNQTQFDEGLQFAQDSSGTLVRSICSFNEGMYCFYAYYNSQPSIIFTYLETSPRSTNVGYVRKPNGSSDYTCQTRHLNSSTGYYYGSFTMYSEHDVLPLSDYSIFSDVDTGFAALIDYIDNVVHTIHTIPVVPSSPYVFGSLNGIDYLTHVENEKLSACANLNDTLIVASLSSSADIQVGRQQSAGSSSIIMSDVSLSPVSVGDNNLYVGTYNPVDVVYSSDLKTYTDTNICYSDLYDYLFENGGSSDVPSVWVNKPLTIPQGYAAVIDTTNMTAGKGGFRLRANTGNLGNSNLWRDVFGNDNIQSGQAVYSTSTSITTYNFDSYPQLTWSPCEYSLIRATAYEYISEAPKSSTYTYIFNPIQANAQAIKTGQPTNAYITLYMNDAFDGTVKLFPLTSMAALGEGQRIDVSETETGSGDISNGTWTDGNGNVVSPPQGGGNGEGSSSNPLQAISATIESLGNTIRDFAANVANLLSAPVEAIQTLIGAGSEFVGNLSGLYTWLPPQVYSVLTSAIILVIVIGVLKVLL